MLRKRRFRWAVILAAVLLLASEGFSLLLRAAGPRRYLTARLESSFGRPVEVGTFSFSLLDGPRIEALNVSVAEDPRFGREYFLRADQLTAGPSWSALLSGHFEFGTLSFLRPTLNLVRMSDGHWNLESWLPAAAAPASAQAANRAPGPAPRSVLRFHLSRIEIDSGRINFKQGDDVRQFALANVTGDLEQQSPGRWQLDFETQPFRPGAALPQSGTVRLRGIVGGTSARLQPADLDLSLWDASIEDALRLALGRDFGIRGAISADLHANIEKPSPGDSDSPSIAQAQTAEWDVTGVVRLANIHRWDLAANPSAPSVNVAWNARWRSGEARIEIVSCDVQAPASALSTSGELAWNHGFHPHLSLAPSQIAYDDLLAWYRALRPGVNGDLAARGWLQAEGSIEDWPPRLVDASLASAGAEIDPPAPLAPLRFGRWNTSLKPGALDSSLIVVQFAPAPDAPRPNQLRVQASLLFPLDGRLAPRGNSRFRVSVDGTADRIQDYVLLARELGGSIAPAWSADGSLAFHVHGQGDFRPRATDWQGSIESRDLLLQFGFLNQPLYLPDATLDLGPGAAQKLTLASAHGFDGIWTGTIFRSTAHPAWQFDLSADRLDASALDRWIEPRARPAGLLARLGLGSADESAGDAGSPPPALMIPIAARGRLRVAEFSLVPLRLEHLDADVEVTGKTIAVHHAQAAFSGGTVEGDFIAALGPVPNYDANAKFDRVDLRTLAQQVPSLAGRFDGAAAGDITLHASGIGRDELLDSLNGQGSIAARNLQINGFNLAVFAPTRAAVDSERFAQAQATFNVADRAIHASPVRLTKPGESLVATGSVAFDGSLDFHLVAPGAPPAIAGHGASLAPPADPQAQSSGGYSLTGTVADPQLLPFGAPPAPPPAHLSHGPR